MIVPLGCLLAALAGLAPGGDPDPADVRAVEAFLARFDAAHETGDAAKVSALLVDEPAACRRRCESIVRRSVAGLERRRSALLVLRREADALGAYLRADVTRRGAPGAAAAIEETQQFEFLLLRPSDDGLRVAALHEFDPREIDAARADPIGCGGCNWVLRKPPACFAVWRTRGGCAATEGITFVPASGGPAVEFRVLELLEPADPLRAARLDDERLAAETKAPPSAVRAIAGGPRASPEGASGVSTETVLTLADGESLRAIRAYFARGRTLYAFVLAGRDPVVEPTRGLLASLADSFRIVEPGRPEEGERRGFLRHHPGGTLQGNAFAFDGEGLRLSIAAPEGWTGTEMSGPSLFRVRFVSPEKGARAFLEVYAVEDPKGWDSSAAVADEIARRDAELRACGARELRRAELVGEHTHAGLRATAYRGDATWTDDGDTLVREVLLFAPIGRHGIFVVARADAAAYEGLSPLFKAAFGSLARR